MRPRLLADMNISPKTVDALQQRGWDVIRVSQVLPKDAPDDEILNYARKEGRVVITQDLDFSALLALGGHERPSLISLRLSICDPETVTRRLVEVLPGLEEMLRRGSVVAINDVAVRIRGLPIE